MKNNKIILILIAIIILITSLFYYSKQKSTNIEDTKQLWNIYDINIENIKNNLDPITVPNEYFFWWELKDFDIEDKTYKQNLNNLVADIRMCYLELTDDGTLYTNTNPIKQYRNKTKITKKKLEQLNIIMQNEFKTGCLKNFNRYSGILISNNQLDTDNFLSNINKIYTYNKSNPYKNTNTYNELLSKKILETSILEDLSEYLVLEYNRLK